MEIQKENQEKQEVAKEKCSMRSMKADALEGGRLKGMPE